MNARQQRAKQMMEIPGYVRQIRHDLFEVSSQFTPEKYYLVSTTDKRLVCECLRSPRQRIRLQTHRDSSL